MKTIYDLKLHEYIEVDVDVLVTRVPGGWIYEFRKPRVNILQPVFVPYNNEFQKPAKTDYRGKEEAGI